MKMNNKYFLYARKSSEAEDKQAMSVESQIEELERIAKEKNLKIVGTFKEEMSAKAPGRPVFNQMVSGISEGKANGILCWRLNRLARNPVDGGTIGWMLQQGVISHIVASDREYYPESDVLMMSVEFGMANKFILDLRKDTRRGVDKKIRSGWYPSYAPCGYLNDKTGIQGQKKIYKDPETFDVMKRLWDMLLTGVYSVSRVAQEAKKMGIKSRRTKRYLQTSTLYRIFTNIFYTSKFKYMDKIYQGQHEPMISEAEFDRAQIILGKRGKPQPKTHHFAFTGMMRCGECGAMITAEEKHKIQKNGNIHHYIYYRCTKRKDPNCTQGSIKEEELNEQINAFLINLSISERFKSWAIKQLRQLNEKETGERTKIYHLQQKAYNDSQRQIDNLLDMRLKELIDDNTYKAKQEALLNEQGELKKRLDQTEDRAANWLELAEQTFEFSKNACYWFNNGTIEDKKIILSTIGSNLVLKDRKLRIEPVKLFSMIREPEKVCDWGG